MQKFYVHRTALAYVTEVVEIEATDAEAAKRAVVFDSEGESIGTAPGDYFDGGPDEKVEVFEAAPHNLPATFQPFPPLAAGDAENEKFPLTDWRYEVANGDTKLGYSDWLAKNLEQAKFEESRYETAARAKGWTLAGDNGGIIYNTNQYDSWKEAASWAGDGGPNDNGPIYSSWQECCEAEGIEV